MLKYSNLGTGKQLNQIVMAGSHDAGVTEGGGNVQTQNMDIFLQAYAGVRLFDIRIAGVSQKDQGLGKEAQLKALPLRDQVQERRDSATEGSREADRPADGRDLSAVNGAWVSRECFPRPRSSSSRIGTNS